MTSTIGVYETHDQAVTAAKELRDAGFSAKHISILGKTEVEHHHEDMNALENTATRGVGVGILTGSTIGLLTGAGVFAIPGLGFLFGAGALVGAIAGLDLGLLGGGLFSALKLGFGKEHHEMYEQHLREGKFILVVHGSKEEVAKANGILQKHGQHLELNTH
jgi:hypothetical protein